MPFLIFTIIKLLEVITSEHMGVANKPKFEILDKTKWMGKSIKPPNGFPNPN